MTPEHRKCCFGGPIFKNFPGSMPPDTPSGCVDLVNLSSKTLNPPLRSIGILCKRRYYVTLPILIQLYYSLIYPFLTYGIIIWGNTYMTTLHPLNILQKKAMRLMTFSNFDEHTEPLFKRNGLLKLNDLIFLYNSLFMYDFYNNKLPLWFENFFLPDKLKHSYNTRLALKKFVLSTLNQNKLWKILYKISRSKNMEQLRWWKENVFQIQV